MRQTPRFLPILCILVVALGAMFDRTWRFGEVLSPGDLLDSFYPWAYDGPRREPSNATRSDEAFYHQPLVATHWPRLAQGDLPEWDPLVLAGTPAFHQGLDVGRVFSPLSAPYYVWPADVATTIYGVLRLLCAGLFMWIYLQAAGMSAPASALGAAAFGLNGAFVVWLSAPMPTVALWLPLIVLGVERVCTRRRLRDAAGLALALGAQFLGSYAPTSLVVLAVAAVWSCGWLLATRGSGSVRPGSAGLPGTAGLLTLAGIAGAALGAAALWPMLATLADSPVGSRSMQAFTLPWQNLATFAVPDVWGTPLERNWWYPGSGNYPELVTYLGIAPLVIAVAGLTARREVRVVLAALVAAGALMQMYGWPPGSWVGALPGLRQVNPHRWNVALAFAVAVLAARGLDAIVSNTAPSGRSHRDRHRWPGVAWAAAGTLLVAGLAAAGLWSELETVRRLGLQSFEKTRIAVFVAWSLITMLLLIMGSQRVGRTAAVAAWLLALVTAADLVSAGRGFNPTAPPARLYETTPGIGYLRAAIGHGRIAPVGASHLLPESHVWGMYGLESVTGFDFFGDPYYQAFMARVDGGRATAPIEQPAPTAARWAHVGLAHADLLNLRLLGLLGVGLIVTPPVDTMTHDAGYTTLGAMTPGRTIDQIFTARQHGLRRIDVLVATHARVNRGAWQVSVTEAEPQPEAGRSRVMGSWRIATETLCDLDWLRLEFPAQADSRQRRYRVRIVVEEVGPDGGATVMATTAAGLDGGALEIDGRADPRTLWLRAFSDAPQRIPGASPVYAHDLNVYRNPLALPPAWFVREVRVASRASHLDLLTTPGFDPASTVLVDQALDGVPGPGASVTAFPTRHGDERTYAIDAPGGGVIVFAERYDPHWRLETDGRPVRLTPADAVLMAAAVPPGTSRLTLRYSRRDWSIAFLISGLALVGILIALVNRR